MNKQDHRNSYGQLLKSCLMILLPLFLSAFFIKSYALVFNIVPNGSLPTSVEDGTTASASYVIQNNTLSQRNNNFIKYLPPHVSIAPGGCGSTFNLAPHGQPGDSCILNLSVSGSVNPNDPDPHHHLFACFPGGITCAGTNFPLNVILIPTPPPPPHLVSISITPVNATVAIGGTQQYIAIGHFSNGATQDITTRVLWNSSNPGVATINATGLAQGLIGGTTNITASLGPITSNTAILTVSNTILFVPHLNNIVTFCPVNPSGPLGTCADTGGTGFVQPSAIAINNANTIGYVLSATFVSICPINPNGTFGVCTTFTDPLLTSGAGIALDPSNSFAYISNETANTVIVCPVLPGGGLGACVDSGNTGTGFLTPFDIVVNNAGTIAYIMNFGNGQVSMCPILPGGTFGSCTQTAFLIDVPGGLTLNNANTFAFITDVIGGVIACEIDVFGNLGNCVTAAPASTFATPTGIRTNSTDTVVYVANFDTSIVSRCTLNGNGTFSNCISDHPSGSTGPLNLAITN